MWSVLAGEDVSSHPLDDEERCDQPDYKKYARIDHNVQEIAVILRLVGVGGRLGLIAHVDKMRFAG